MPAAVSRLKQRVRAIELIDGVNREHYIPWQDVAVAASLAGWGASSVVAQISGSGPAALNIGGASSGCFVGIAFRAPQDMAIAAPAAGSGQLWLDWTDKNAAGRVVTIAACVIYIPSGSEYTATGASQRLGSACVQLTGGSANANNAASVLNFTAPADRDGLFLVRFAPMGQDAANTSGCHFCLYGLRLRYKADRIGS